MTGTSIKFFFVDCLKLENKKTMLVKKQIIKNDILNLFVCNSLSIDKVNIMKRSKEQWISSMFWMNALNSLIKIVGF